MTITTLYDYVFVKVDSTVNDTVGNIKIDTRFNTGQHARLCGEVIAAPTYLHNKTPLYTEYEGSPKYLRHVTSEFVANIIRHTPKHHRENPAYTKAYRCGSYEPKNVYDTPRVLKGDKVYFQYNSLLNEENFWCKEGNDLIYKLEYRDLICLVRDGEINMLNGHVLVDEYRKEIHTFLYLPNNKPHPRIGRLAHVCHDIGPDTRNVKPGDYCIFKNNLFTVKEYDTMKDEHEISGYEIEGHRYYVMKTWDIVATISLKTDHAYEFENDITPAGDYIMLKPDRERLDNTVVYDPNKEQDVKGKVLILDASVKKVAKNKKYGTGTWLKSGENAPVMGGKIWYAKPSFYWMEEYDVAFVRLGDVLGCMTEINE